MESTKFIYYPMLVSGRGAAPLTPDEDKRIWERYDALPEFNRQLLIAHELPDRIEELQTKFRLEEDQTANVSFLIRQYYFGEIKLEALRAALLEIASHAPGAWEFFQERVLSVKPTIGEEKSAPASQELSEVSAPRSAQEAVALPLLQALSRYPELASQQITSEKIRIRSEREPVRPTLMHWLKYYRDELGIGYHDSVQRGQFLYRSENGRRLSPEERERINLVLKSVEDELPLSIDPERKTVCFPAFEKSAAPVPPKDVPPAPPRTMEDRYRALAPAPSVPRPAPAEPAAPKFSFSPAPEPAPLPKPDRKAPPKARPLPPAPLSSDGTESIAREPAFEPVPLRKSFFQKAASTAPLGNITFTTRHVMPAEEIGKSIPVPAAVPQAAPKPAPRPMKRSPFSIRPVSRS